VLKLEFFDNILGAEDTLKKAYGMHFFGVLSAELRLAVFVFCLLCT
jgi:hypothetical protein